MPCPACLSQALTYGVTLANYDHSSPSGPLPRNNAPNLIPFCLNAFNFATLDEVGSTAWGQ
jgi:hypothetical protein